MNTIERGNILLANGTRTRSTVYSYKGSCYIKETSIPQANLYKEVVYIPDKRAWMLTNQYLYIKKGRKYDIKKTSNRNREESKGAPLEE